MVLALPARLRRLGWQLPLSIAGLLLAVVGAFSWVAYREVQQAALAAAGERLEDVSRQLASLLAQSVEQRLAETRRLATNPDVVRALRSRSQAEVRRARPALERLLRSTEQISVVQLWDAAGQRLVEAARVGTATLPTARRAFPAWARDNAVAVSGIRAAGDTIWYQVAAAAGPTGRTLGYVVQYRRLSSSSQAVQLINDLIGSDARFVIGEPQGTWTDLVTVVEPPAPAVQGVRGVAQYQSPAGTWRLGAASPIARTPWFVWVEFPRAVVLARPIAFLRRIVFIALAIVLLGAAGGWVVSRRITSRLGQLTAAAAAMAEGEHGRRVTVVGRDELGELAAAFNTMAETVENAQRRLEDQVAQRTAELRASLERLEAANQELEAFSYSVSHDLRAPLRSMHGFSQVLLEDYRDRLDEEGAGYLRRVCAGAEHMSQLIDDLLELSRVSRAELQRERIDLSGLAQRTADELGRQEPARAVEFRIAEGLVAEGDQRLLTVVLRNLLDNAWKFTSGKANATIQFGAVTSNGQSAYFVRDNGVGFDMTYADKLFGAFQRLHAAGEFPGTGVGLAIVQRIIHRHGGRAWADGAVGAGATFYFTLPAP